MADYDYNRSDVLEGMYKGVEGKLDEVRSAVSKEIQFSTTQQASAYEAISESLREGVETLLRELKYLSQQNSAIHEYNQNAQEEFKDELTEAVAKKAADSLKDELIEAIGKKAEETAETLEKKFDEKIEALRKEMTSLSEELAASVAESAAAAEPAPAEEPAEAVAEEPAEETEEPEKPAPAKDVRDFEDGFDYDVLAEKIATILPEVDYDLLADKVIAALPQTDADAIADKVAAAVPIPDEGTIADRVAETIPMVDYDLVAERVGATLEHDFYISLDESGLDAVAEKVAAYLQEGIAEKVAEAVGEKISSLVEEKLAALPAPAPAPAPAPVEEEVAAAAVPAPAPAPKPKPAPKPAPVRPVVVPVVTDPNLMTRYKRSFTAKIIESEEEIKEYYSTLKNELLSYSRVSSQINWSNDRYAYRGDTIAKIGVRGRTLCVYLALNPAEFPESTYHQKFAGDTKMYEKTPLMMKVKSGVALKRTLRLIELLMERVGAMKEEIEPVDYVSQYAFRSEEKLLEEGLIKTAIVEKSDLDF